MHNLRLFGVWLWHHKLSVFGAFVVLALTAGAGGAATGLALEENNDLCMQCHTQPEYDYWARTQLALKPPHVVDDLATYHIVPAPDNKQPDREPLKCISCHGGTNLQERLATEFELGALDTLKFVAVENIQQPARTTHPLPNSYCLQCHVKDVERTGFDNHFHNKMDDPKAPPLACVSCHVSHAEADVLEKYILREKAYPLCNECHKQLGGPINLQ